MTETITPSEFKLLETAHEQTRRDLAELRGTVDDNHADLTERIDQLRSDLHRAIGTSERRLKALEQHQRQALDHLATLTGKVTAHDTRFDKVDSRFDKVDSRLDTVEGKLDEVLRRLPAAG